MKNLQVYQGTLAGEVHLTSGDVYENSSDNAALTRVRNDVGDITLHTNGHFRLVSLDDAYSRTHWFDGSVTPNTSRHPEGLILANRETTPGLEKASAQPTKPSDQQVGGDHYKKAAIQPAVFAELNGLTHLEANVVKRVYRHSRGGKGREDIEKAIHELQLLLELRY